MPDPDLEIENRRGVGESGHPDPYIGGGGGGLPKLFSTLPPPFGLKIRARAPSLDPPLV